MSAALLCSVAAGAGAQSLASRVTSSDGPVQVVYPSRPEVCGDGMSYINHVVGEPSGSWESRPCIHGPARVVATVISGEVTRLRAYVGPDARSSEVRTIAASADEASAWLGSLIQRGSPKIAGDAMMPLLIADVSTEPWPMLLRVARDDSRPLAVRRSALMWIGMGVSDKLGLSGERAATDDDEMREQAVFVLSQRPKSESVPELMDLAKNAKYPVVRKSAIFWLGQTGDLRAADVYADLLKIR